MSKYNLIISDKEKYVYFRVPKTATTSLSIYLRNNSSISVDSYDYELKSIPKNYFKFSIVRNPWDRILSCFLDKTKRAINTVWEMEFYKQYADLSFVDFVGILNEKIINYDSHLMPQHKLFDINNIDFIGKFENLNKDVRTIQKKIGLPIIDLQIENKTDHDHYRKYYDKKTKYIVYNLYLKDIEKFNYEY
jgi:hypothetical protein